MKTTSIFALTLLAGASLEAAVITQYTDRTAFLSQLQPGAYLEDFSALSNGDLGAFSLPFSGGSPPLSLTIETRNAANTFAGDNLYLADTGNLTKALGTSTTQSDQLRINVPGLYAIGGDWFLSTIDEDYEG